MRMGRLVWCGSALLVAVACSASDQARAVDSPAVPEFASGDSATIIGFVDSLLAATRGASISLAVGTGDGLFFEAARGLANIEDSTPASVESQYRIGSASKVLGSTLLFRFIEDGTVGLDDPIQRWVPSFPTKDHPITVGHVLTHTSGIRHYDGHRPQDRQRHGRDFQSFEEAISLFKNDPLLHEPGSAWHYSSYGFNLIQGILESAGGGSVESVMDSLLFQPLGMRSTLVEEYGNRPAGLVPAYYWNAASGRLAPDRPGNPSYKKIAGGMVSTPRDLVRLMQALDQDEIIAEATFDRMMERPYPFAPGQAHGWRYGERDDGEVLYHHGGTTRGFVAFVAFLPDSDIYVAVTANYADFYDVRSKLAFFLVDRVKQLAETGSVRA